MENTNNIISKVFEGKNIRQRETDGYISATDMCKTFGKLFAHYAENKSTKEYVDAVSRDIGYPIPQLVEIHKGNSAKFEQGTWVHPMVATHLAQWLSPTFAIQVNKWVIRYLSGDITLVKDVIEQHDKTHNTITVANVAVVDNDIERRKKLAEIIEIETKTTETKARVKQMEIANMKQQQELILSLDSMQKGDVQVYTAFKNYVINSIMPTQNLLAANSVEEYSKDISQLYKETHCKIAGDDLLKKIGMEARKEYQRRYCGQMPQKVKKHCNGALRDVNLYSAADHTWLVDIIKKY